MKSLAEEVEDAQARYLKHLELEEQRERAKLPTDFERYLNGDQVKD
jgi:hypothetical protein